MTDRSFCPGKKTGRARSSGTCRTKGVRSRVRRARTHEPAQYPLHHRSQRTVRSGEPRRIDAQELLEVLLDETKEGRLPRPTRLVHPRTDLHATPTAGGRDRRASRTSPSCGAGRRVCDELASRQVRRGASDRSRAATDRPWTTRKAATSARQTGRKSD